MQITKIHAAGSDYLLCPDAGAPEKTLAPRLLDRRTGIGADGLLWFEPGAGTDIRLHMVLPNGREEMPDAAALIAAAKYLYDGDPKKSTTLIGCGERAYSVRLSVLRGRVLCAWLAMPPIVPRPMEQLKYYHGVRGEVLRACLAHPRISIYELGGAHAVFLLESCAALRALQLQSVCRRLEEVLFWGEAIDLHFAAIAGDNLLSMRSWRCRVGELAASGEGAVLGAYAATAAELCDAPRIMVKCVSGSFCVELCGKEASLCAKCETIFVGEAV
ncbi:MAG: hypothetical protein IIU58_03470 [Clostridia bacterium]|nr:hypothetical protein [Clostridia bacterium]